MKVPYAINPVQESWLSSLESYRYGAPYQISPLTESYFKDREEFKDAFIIYHLFYDYAEMDDDEGEPISREEYEREVYSQTPEVSVYADPVGLALYNFANPKLRATYSQRQSFYRTFNDYLLSLCIDSTFLTTQQHSEDAVKRGYDKLIGRLLFDADGLRLRSLNGDTEPRSLYSISAMFRDKKFTFPQIAYRVRAFPEEYFW